MPRAPGTAVTSRTGRGAAGLSRSRSRQQHDTVVSFGIHTGHVTECLCHLFSAACPHHQHFASPLAPSRHTTLTSTLQEQVWPATHSAGWAPPPGNEHDDRRSHGGGGAPGPCFRPTPLPHVRSPDRYPLLRHLHPSTLLPSLNRGNAQHRYSRTESVDSRPTRPGQPPTGKPPRLMSAPPLAPLPTVGAPLHSPLHRMERPDRLACSPVVPFAATRCTMGDKFDVAVPRAPLAGKIGT